MSPTKYDSTGRRQSTVRQDAHGSVILSDGYEDVIQLDALGAARECFSYIAVLCSGLLHIVYM